MKRTITILLLLSVLFGLCACSLGNKEKKYVLETIVIGSMEISAEEYFAENPQLDRDHYSLVLYDDGTVVLTEGDKKQDYKYDSEKIWSDSSDKKEFYWDEERALFPMDDNTLFVFERD